MVFLKEFNTLLYVMKNSKRVLLVAHSNPDGDTVGSVLALKEYLLSLGKKADIFCESPEPDFLKNITDERFINIESLDLSSYDAVIGCDSVERGFTQIAKDLPKDAVTVAIDHHPDMAIRADITIIDPKKSSVCEMIYDFLVFSKAKIDKKIATYLMMGILSDTGSFQHSNTSVSVMSIASDLMKKGAQFSKILKTTFSNKKISTLKLWGLAFEKAKINEKNGMIVTALTQKDMEKCNASSEDLGYIASILNTVPGTKFSLILSEKEGGFVKGSLRSEEYKGVDVSRIAQGFGGGGHRLASGFTVKGKIVEKPNGWEIQ